MDGKIIYDNYVYMTICEVTLKHHKESNFPTHLGYCKTIRQALIDKTSQINPNKINLYPIIEELDKIFTMDEKTTGEYIMNYFIEEKYKIFEKPILSMNAFFSILSL